MKLNKKHIKTFDFVCSCNQVQTEIRTVKAAEDRLLDPQVGVSGRPVGGGEGPNEGLIR